MGARLNQDPNALDLENPQTIVFQSDDPVMQQRAEAYIRYSIIYGKPSDPRLSPKVMPAFGQDLNVEEVNDLVYLLMYGDWDYVYNEAVLATGHSQAQADCDADPSNEEACENAHNDEYALYPTVPPPADAGEDEESATPATSEDGAVLLEAQDPFNWSATELTVAPGDTIEVVNVGVLDHDLPSTSSASRTPRSRWRACHHHDSGRRRPRRISLLLFHPRTRRVGYGRHPDRRRLRRHPP